VLRDAHDGPLVSERALSGMSQAVTEGTCGQVGEGLPFRSSGFGTHPAPLLTGRARPPPPLSQLSLHFFPGEPVLMSSASDNSVKHWIFDGPDEAGRLLRFRSGHSAPPTCVLHYGQVSGKEGGISAYSDAYPAAVDLPLPCRPTATLSPRLRRVRLRRSLLRYSAWRFHLAEAVAIPYLTALPRPPSSSSRASVCCPQVATGLSACSPSSRTSRAAS